MIARGHSTLVNYPDGTSKVVTLYVGPAKGQIIAHGWEITNVASGENDGDRSSVDYEISVARPNLER